MTTNLAWGVGSAQQPRNLAGLEKSSDRHRGEGLLLELLRRYAEARRRILDALKRHLGVGPAGTNRIDRDTAIDQFQRQRALPGQHLGDESPDDDVTVLCARCSS